MSNCSNFEVKAEVKLQCYVTWKVPDFFSLPDEVIYFLDSPKFQFDGGTWCLRLFPNYQDRFCRRIIIWLMRMDSSVPEQSYTSSIGVVMNSGKEHVIQKGHDTVKDFTFQGQKLFGSVFYIGHGLVQQNRHKFAPRDTLTVFCRVHLNGMSVIPMSPAAKEHAATKAEIEPPSCGMKIRSGEKVRSDYKKLLKSGSESDLLIVVSGHEFRAHKCILRARSPVFDAMFEHETAEKESGKVVIDDLHPDPFRDFLEYMYTGSMGAFSNENFFGLYTAADKYNVQELKLEAAQYMKRTICVESFSDIMILALRHQEKELMDCAVNFFKNNMYDIILTVKWQVFMKDNVTAANELFIKALAPRENKSK